VDSVERKIQTDFKSECGSSSDTAQWQYCTDFDTDMLIVHCIQRGCC